MLVNPLYISVWRVCIHTYVSHKIMENILMFPLPNINTYQQLCLYKHIKTKLTCLYINNANCCNENLFCIIVHSLLLVIFKRH